MRANLSRAVIPTLAALLGLGLAGGLIDPPVGIEPAAAQDPQAQAAPGEVLLTFSVGGVLTEDGTLWQYVPDENRWLTIDEAFAEQGKQTRVLPLPVGASEVRQMESFGFLLTKRGEMWLYGFNDNLWRKLAAPRQ